MSIITVILNFAVGLLFNKTRDATAKKLKDDDDTKFRETIMRDLNDSKTKLEGLSRKNLLTSFNFLEEGIGLLTASLDEIEDKRGYVENDSVDDHDDASIILNGISQHLALHKRFDDHGKASKTLKLINPLQKSAKEKFEDASTRATFAFCNESLSIQDRIFAAKLCVVSEILGCLDSPETAVTSIMLPLERLHDLPAVRDIFSVYLSGGIWSMFGKVEREENVKSVMMINYAVYQFASTFTSMNFSKDKWPIIQLSDRSFNPIWNWEEISTPLKLDRVIEPPSLNVRVQPIPTL